VPREREPEANFVVSNRHAVRGLYSVPLSKARKVAEQLSRQSGEAQIWQMADWCAVGAGAKPKPGAEPIEIWCAPRVTPTPALYPGDKSSIAEWSDWLKRIASAGEIDLGVVDGLRLVFEQVIVPTGAIPGGMATAEGFLLTWNIGEHHLEVELFPDRWEWFYYKNRSANEDASQNGLVPIAPSFAAIRVRLLQMMDPAPGY
jgi:hypothetical protein